MAVMSRCAGPSIVGALLWVPFVAHSTLSHSLCCVPSNGEQIRPHEQILFRFMLQIFSTISSLQMHSPASVILSVRIFLLHRRTLVSDRLYLNQPFVPVRQAPRCRSLQCLLRYVVNRELLRTLVYWRSQWSRSAPGLGPFITILQSIYTERSRSRMPFTGSCVVCGCSSMAGVRLGGVRLL